MTQLFNAGQVGMCVDAIALYQTLIDPNESSFYDKVGGCSYSGRSGRTPVL